MENKIKLSIITPYYKVLEYTKRLAEVLEPQLTDEVEWIIVDDGCDEKDLDKLKATVIHLENNSGGASKPRNVGLEVANGEYIVFIDADDLVFNDYVKTILDKIYSEEFDYCYISWKSKAFNVVIQDEPPAWNLCVWNCIYKRELIGNERFSLEIIIGEDYDFNVRVRKGKKSNIEKILYYYNDTPNSLMKRGTKNG